jgi:glutamine synthetase
MITLNTAVADQLIKFKKDVDAVKAKGVKKDEAIFQVLRKYITQSKAIRFEGNNYSEEWKKEAVQRGLSAVTDVPEMFESYLTEKSKKLFVNAGVFNEIEIEARAEIRWETYIKQVQIEARVLGDLVNNHVIPVSIDYMTSLINNVRGLREIYSEKEFKELASVRLEVIKEISSHITTIKTKTRDMIEERKVANKIEDVRKRADYYSNKVFPYFEDIRYYIDKLELIVDNEQWPLPKYRELLFTR